jgi:hypothetical protein
MLFLAVSAIERLCQTDMPNGYAKRIGNAKRNVLLCAPSEFEVGSISRDTVHLGNAWPGFGADFTYLFLSFTPKE